MKRTHSIKEYKLTARSRHKTFSAPINLDRPITRISESNQTPPRDVDRTRLTPARYSWRLTGP